MTLVAIDAATAGLRWRWLSVLTRLWYNDRYRSVTMLGFFTVALAVLGIVVLVEAGQRARFGHRLSSRSATAIIIATAVVTGIPAAASTVGDRYANASELPGRSLVSVERRQFYEAMAQLVPPGEKVLNNAADGSAFMFAYGGVHPVFFAIGAPPSTPNGDVLQQTLVTAPDHVHICQMVRSDGIGWVLAPAVSYSDKSVAPIRTPGIEIPENFWLTSLALSNPSKELRLYRITGCPTPVP